MTSGAIRLKKKEKVHFLARHQIDVTFCILGVSSKFWVQNEADDEICRLSTSFCEKRLVSETSIWCFSVKIPNLSQNPKVHDFMPMVGV